MSLGNKLAEARKKQNLTQEQLAERLGVTRQAVSRWESDTAYPETDKIVRMAQILEVSCDYLLQDGVDEKGKPVASPVTRLLKQAQGKRVRLTFYEEDSGMPIFHEWCVIRDFDGGWANVEVVTNKRKPEKSQVRLIPLSAISTITFLKDGETADYGLSDLF
ncbi:MAG: helix-turn-helix domain-containing protein [Oscillospiraceae bacterium]|nr:helix-turn-helix domain-containing protein [Oscillospiraceae bacterium]